jgi:hypothetical protein
VFVQIIIIIIIIIIINSGVTVTQTNVFITPPTACFSPAGHHQVIREEYTKYV